MQFAWEEEGCICAQCDVRGEENNTLEEDDEEVLVSVVVCVSSCVEYVYVSMRGDSAGDSVVVAEEV